MRYHWHKKQTAFLIRLLISAGLIFFLFKTVNKKAHTENGDSIWETLLNANWWLFALAMVFSLTKQGIEIFRLYLLFRVKRIHVPLWTMIKIMMTGTFLGTVAPTSLSTEIIRAYGFSQHIEDAADAVSAVAINRFIGLLSLIVLATVSSIWEPEYAKSIGIVWLMIVFSIPVILVVLGLSKRLRQLLQKGFFQKIEFLNRTIQWLSNVGRSFYLYRKHGFMLFMVFLLSILFQSIRVVVTYLLAMSLNVHIPLAYFFIITPIILLATTLPLSVGGLGVREGGTVYFLGKINIPPTQALSVSIMWFIAALTSSIPGLFFYLIEGVGGKKRKKQKDLS